MVTTHGTVYIKLFDFAESICKTLQLFYLPFLMISTCQGVYSGLPGVIVGPPGSIESAY